MRHSAETIADRVVDGLFIQESTGENMHVPVKGIRGWISPFADSYANRVITTNTHCRSETIQAVMGFFSQRSAGVTWVVRQDEISSGLPQMLMEMGFKPGRYHKVAGMFLQTDTVRHTPDSEVYIRNVTPDDEEALLETIIAATKMSSIEHQRYLFRHGAAPGNSVRHLSYLAYVAGVSHPVGYGKSAYFSDHQTVMLNGAGVIEAFRCRGVYAQLLQHRMQAAIECGRKDFIIQSARDSSFPTCVRFGFQEVCEMEFYQWSPESASI